MHHIKYVLIALAALVGLGALVGGAVVGCTAWLYTSTSEQHYVGATATFGESADCLSRYANNHKGWTLDKHSVFDCFPTQTAPKEKALIGCFNTYERKHPSHDGWPEDNMRGCTWDGLTAVPAPHVLSLAFGKAMAVPAAPRAGRPFALKVPVTRNDSNAKIAHTAIETDPKLDIAVTIDGEDVVTGPPSGLTDLVIGFFPDGKFHVNFTVPKTAEGKRLTIKMTISAGTPTVTKIVTFVVGR